MKKFEFLDHTSEIKIKAFGKTLSKVFENSVLAVSSLISRGKEVKGSKMKEIRIEGGDNERMLHSLIDEVIYLLDAENFIVSKANVDFDENVGSMFVKFYGDDSNKYSGLDHVKAATYAEIYVKKTKGLWEAQFVVDV